MMLVGGSFVSCDDDFLETTQYDIVYVDKKFATQDDADKTLNGVYKMVCVDMDGANGGDGDWGFKPNLFTGCHPTMDTQATGWDKAWNAYNWNPGSKELNDGWKHAYVAIDRANEFIAEIESAELPAEYKTKRMAEARALRGFFYHWLATTFKTVPMLSAEEDNLNTPTKARADVNELWDFIIEDFKAAAAGLDWKPDGDQYGRCTKGMALTYLGDAYMWKAYRNNETNGDNIKAAQAAFKEVLDSHTYELSPSFATLWDVTEAWPKEAIWQEINDEINWSSWSDNTSRMFTKFYCACPENGGWGSLYLSWEWWASYENGDKRRDASGCTGAIEDIRSEWKSSTSYGINPFIGEPLNNPEKTGKYHYDNGEYAPSIWSTKLWHNASAKALGGGWGAGVWQPLHIYWKRLPNVMLDYAECCFLLGQDDEGWAQIDALRARAWGKKEAEVGKDALTAKYLPKINEIRSALAAWGEPYTTTDTYPIPFNEDVNVNVPSAKDYYTALAASGPTWFDAVDRKPYKSPAWKVALNMERRKEFNAEWCLRPDMQRSGFMEDHIETNYPKRNNGNIINIPWTDRTFDFSDDKLNMPIPSDEIIKNPACDQNPGY